MKASKEFHPISSLVLLIFILPIYPNLEGFNVWHMGKCTSNFQLREEAFGEEDIGFSAPRRGTYPRMKEFLPSLKVLLGTIVSPPKNTSWRYGAMRRHEMALERLRSLPRHPNCIKYLLPFGHFHAERESLKPSFEIQPVFRRYAVNQMGRTGSLFFYSTESTGVIW